MILLVHVLVLVSRYSNARLCGRFESGFPKSVSELFLLGRAYSMVLLLAERV